MDRSVRQLVVAAAGFAGLAAAWALVRAWMPAGKAGREETLYERTFIIYEPEPGTATPDMLIHHSQPIPHQPAGQAREDLQQYQRTLASDERALGAKHPVTLVSRYDLAVAYLQAERPAQAIQLFKRNLAMCERVLGADHLRTVLSCQYLAHAYLKAGRPAEAIVLFERNLADHLRGASGRDKVVTLNNLACAYLEAGQLAKAISVYEKALLRCQQELETGHPVAITVRNNFYRSKAAEQDLREDGR